MGNCEGQFLNYGWMDGVLVEVTPFAFEVIVEVTSSCILLRTRQSHRVRSRFGLEVLPGPEA